MKRTSTRDKKLLKTDIAFVVLGLVAVVGLFAEGFDTTAAIDEAANPLMVGIALVVLVAIGALIVSVLANIDRKDGEEYSFLLLANASVVAVVTTIVIALLWSFDFLLGYWLAGPSADHILSIMMGTWSVGYFTYRVRGLAQ